jgi:hypothetical protein
MVVPEILIGSKNWQNFVVHNTDWRLGATEEVESHHLIKHTCRFETHKVLILYNDWLD